MATHQDDLVANVIVDTSGAVKSLGKYGTAAGRATEKLKEMVNQKGYLYYSMKRIASYTLIFSFFGALVKTMGDVIQLELRLAEVNTLIDKTNRDSVASYNSVTHALLRLDPHLGNAIDLTKGLYEIISAGVTDPIQAFTLLQVSAKYAKVGITDLATAASTLTAVMKAYGYQADQMREISDVLFASVREGKFHTDELNDAIGKILPTAAAMGVSIHEVVSALAIMTQRGMDVNTAATSLNRILISFLRPMDKAKKRFQELGWEWGRDAFAGIGLIGAFERLEVASKRYSDLLPSIFRRQRALKGAFILQGQGLQDLLAIYGRISSAAEGVGIVHREWGVITKTVSEEMHALYANVLQAFSALLKYKGGVADIVSQTSAFLRSLIENVQLVALLGTVLLTLRRVLASVRTGFIGTMVANKAYNFTMIRMEGFIDRKSVV